MQANNNPGQNSGGGNTPKQSGLSWSQPPRAASAPAASTPAATAAVKPVVQTAPKAAPATASARSTSGAAASAGNTSRTLWVFAAGVVVGGLLVGGGMSLMGDGSSTQVANGTGATSTQASQNSQTNSSGNSSVTSGATLPSNGTAAAFSAATQEAGMTVMVSLTKVSAPTWLIVYDNNNGTPGWVLGAGLVFPESPNQVALDLLRPTVAGQTYLIAQSGDVGNDHLYTTGQEAALRDSSGKVMTVSFKTR